MPLPPRPSSTRYDTIGHSYRTTRLPEPRIAAAILVALGDARSIANIGAGAGSYEPTDREVVAIEPSVTMIAQRPPGSAPAIRARAEQLPLAHKRFEAVLAINTLHHWSDISAGLAEMQRVASKRVVIFHRDPKRGAPFWLTEEYLPALAPEKRMISIAGTIDEVLGSTANIAVPLPRNCRDGLFSAYWGEPEYYLDAATRSNISNFALADQDYVNAGIARLEADLRSGVWDRKYGHLRSLPELDLGHRVIVAELL